MSALAITQPTMTTREVAELLNRSHSNIKISAERLAESGVIGTLAAQEFTHNGNTYTEYLLNKRDSLILVAQNCPEFTAKIIDRWQELEAGAAPKLPQTFAQALMLAAQQAAQIEQQQAQLEAAKPAVEFVGRYVQAEGLKGFREVCKLLKANETDFRIFLMGQKIMYRLAGKLMAYQPHIDAGRFAIKAGIAQANEHAYNDCKFTPKGIEWIAGEWAKYRLRESVEA